MQTSWIINDMNKWANFGNNGANEMESSLLDGRNNGKYGHEGFVKISTTYAKQIIFSLKRVIWQSVQINFLIIRQRAPWPCFKEPMHAIYGITSVVLFPYGFQSAFTFVKYVNKSSPVRYNLFLQAEVLTSSQQQTRNFHLSDIHVLGFAFTCSNLFWIFVWSWSLVVSTWP